MAKYKSLKTTHAELSAILGIKNKSLLKGATIVVYRQKKAGTCAMARPCHVCQLILRSFGFKKMIYTIDNGWKEESL